MDENQINNDSSYESILKKASQEKGSPFAFKKIYPAYIVLLITLFVSYGLYQLVNKQVKTDKNNQFDKAVSSVMNRFESENQKNLQVLSSVRGLYDNLVQVVRDYFELYASIPTKTNETILGVIYAPKVKREEAEMFLYNIRSQGLYYFNITPVTKNPVYHPIQFIVPYEKNIHRSGYDLGSDPIISEALNKAIDSNMVVATPVFLVRKPDTTGFLLISPIYRKDANLTSIENKRAYYTGSVIISINQKLFFKKALGSGYQSDTSIIFQCFNLSDDKINGNVIFQSNNADLIKSGYKSDIVTKILHLADKQIAVRFQTVPNFGGSLQIFLPYLTLGVSLFLSFIFFGFLVNTINRKATALGLAERMTRSQRRIVESSNDIIAVLDFNGVWRSMNPASIRILDYEPDELLNLKVDSLFAEKEDLDEFYDMLVTGDENFTRIIDWQMITKTNQIKWVSWSLTFSPSEGLIYSIGRDVTLEKLAEEQDRIRNKQITLAEQLSREASQFKSSFITKLSHILRNSLTGVLGYLDLITYKAYENDDEHDSFVNEATLSSREILDFVMDTSDTWGISGSSRDRNEELMAMTPVKLEPIFINATTNFENELAVDQKVTVKLSDGISNSVAVAEKKFLANVLSSTYKVLTEGLETCEINVNSFENKEDDSTEIVIKAPIVDLLAEMITLYNANINSQIDAIKLDKKDILLRFALAASNYRLMSGKVKIYTDLKEGVNVVSVSLPRNIQQE